MGVCILSIFLARRCLVAIFLTKRIDDRRSGIQNRISSFVCLDEVEKRGNVLFYSCSNQILLLCMIMYTYSAVE